MLLRTIRLRRLTFVLLYSLAIMTIFMYFNPKPPRGYSASGDLTLPAWGTILVVAPHADDETLAAGGLIQAALDHGLDVRVVIVTNGDGFSVAAAHTSRRVRPRAGDFERLGNLRQHESIQALGHLGLAPEHITFLGFPDGGLADLWRLDWSPGRPYRSRYTRASATIGESTARQDLPYAGNHVVSELVELIEKHRPTLVVLPHTADTHPDHWATFNFVTYAIESLRQQGEDWVNDTARWHYIIHSGNWPSPKGLRLEERLVPPLEFAPLVDTWHVLALQPEQSRRKSEAILLYRSQVAIMKRYLLSFARSNELFVVALPPTIHRRTVIPIRHFGTDMPVTPKCAHLLRKGWEKDPLQRDVIDRCEVLFALP